MSEAYIIDAVRTPRGIGKPGKGALSHLHPQHLGATLLKALQERNGFDSADVDDIILAVALQRGKQAGNMARLTALAAGFDPKVSGMTMTRACGGGVTSTGLAAARIASGMDDLIIAGGTEMMSYHQMVAAEDAEKGVIQHGISAGNPELEALHPQSHQGVCADAVAGMEGISRSELDAIGAESQRRADAAIRKGRFSNSLIPVHNLDGSVALDREESPRPGTTLESLAQLKPSFEMIADMQLPGQQPTFRQLINKVYPDLHWDPVHHAGNSSGVVDGAAAILLASREAVEQNGWKPRARVVQSVTIGDCPTLMLNAPVPAAQKVLKRAGLRVDDIDLWEINEAFAVVVEKFIRDLKLDRDKVNVNGGACALGHPIGATGAILIGTLLDELERQDLKRGLITMCAAGGMAPAMIIERI